MQLPVGDNAVPLAEAAQRLGLSTEAVRKRLERGTLSGVKRGRAWYVLMPDEPSGHRPDERPDAEISEMLVTLREQLGVKDQQIERQQTEIERLTVMLADAQTTIRGLLTANVPDRSDRVESPVRDAEPSTRYPARDEPNASPSASGEASQTSSKPRRSWLARLFLGEG